MAAQGDDMWKVSPEILNQNREQFMTFLGSAGRDLIDRVVEGQKKRVIIDLEEVRAHDRESGSSLAKSLVMKPREFLQPLEDAVRRFAVDVRSTAPTDLTVGVTGPIGDSEVSPRNLSSRFLGQIVCLDGIVTKASLVNPKLETAVQYCKETGHYVTRTFHDATSLNEMPQRVALQSKDADGNPLDLEFGLCVFRDHQLLTIQERPESAPAGQMPRSCDVIADKDLADMCKPGDRVKIYGVYRVITGLSGTPSGVYKSMLIANNIEVGNQSVQLELTDEDIATVREIAKKKGITALLGRSLAPSICGHDLIKQAVVMMLVGGTECVLNDGTHIRGDINVLMVGDPSTAKSQILRHVLAVAPLAVHTTGRGSSGVGLTAAVSSDPETGERRLEAGAMVIADRGVVCIDEFDKMDEADRVAIHEALEQQTVTISKAGIHTSLHARCAVCAAANPIWGTYNLGRSPMENIGLPGSLLSRFDLLFIVLDYHDPKVDTTIAEHVLRAHRWRGQVVEADNGVYVQPDPLLHGSGDEDFLTHAFLKKYISYAKARDPVLTPKATEELVRAWTELRGIEGRKTQPLTPRAFETLIRLATAHAKLRLSNKIVASDAKEAIKLLKFAIFGDGETSRKRMTKRSRRVVPDSESEDEETDIPPAPKRRSQRRGGKASQTADDAEADAPEADIDNAHLKMMTEVYTSILKQNKKDSIEYAEFRDYVEKSQKFRPSDAEMNAFLDNLSSADKIMVDSTDGKTTIYFL